MSRFRVTNPRNEAQGLLPSGFRARVLEPSPPAVNDGEYKADDPAAPDERHPSFQLVTPTTAGDVTWDHLTEQLPHLREFASGHWLGAWPRLGTLPDGYTSTVGALGQLAFFAIAPARFASQGKVGLRYAHRGFGTPFYGPNRQIRVEDGYLVVQEGSSAEGEEITTIRRAAKLAGVDYRKEWGPVWHDPPPAVDPDQPLEIEPDAVLACSDVIGFGFSVLEQIRVEAGEDERPSRVQLWPEHFDAAVEVGVVDLGRRAAFGVSPGYGAHSEPFVFVSPWAKDWLEDPYWNADFFGGAILTYSQLLKAKNQRETALGFLRTGLELVRTE